MVVSIKGNGHDQLSVQVPYDPAVVDALRILPHRRWDSRTKTWLIPDRREDGDKLLKVLYDTGLFNEPSYKPTNPPPNRSLLLSRYTCHLETRHYSPRTVKVYVHWVSLFLKFIRDNEPESFSEKDINQFLSHLASDIHVSASTQNQALAALLFLFRITLGKPVGELGSVVRARKPVKLPVVFSREEVRLVLSQIEGEKKLAALLLYGSGMRINECLTLRVQNIEFDRHELLIRSGKGGKGSADHASLCVDTAPAESVSFGETTS